MNVADNTLSSLLTQLKSLLCTETVVGKPFQLGELTLVPLISVSFLVGGAEGADRNNGINIGGGCAGGAGCRVSPQAVLILKGEEVRVFSLTEKNVIESIIESLPEIISRMESFGAVRDNP